MGADISTEGAIEIEGLVGLFAVDKFDQHPDADQSDDQTEDQKAAACWHT